MTIVIFSNGVLGFVALELKAAAFVELGTALENPDFAAMARAVDSVSDRLRGAS